MCGGYPTCAECTALCYKITPCSGAPVYYSNNTALSAFAGSHTVIDGQCVLVESESDISQCCPTADNDLTAAGTYASCAACDTAINPDPCPPTNDEGLPDGDPPPGYASSYAVGDIFPGQCHGSGGVVMTWASGGWHSDGLGVDDRAGTLVGSPQNGWLLLLACNVDGGDDPVNYFRDCATITGIYTKVPGTDGNFGNWPDTVEVG